MAESALSALSLDKVIFIPTGRVSYRDESVIISSEHRINMLELSCKDNKQFEISDIEVKNTEISYTANTLRKFSELLPNSQLYFIVGADSLDYMEEWKDPGQICSLCKVVVIGRRNFENLIDKKVHKLKKHFYADIIKINMPLVEVSSSDIRRRVSDGESIRYMVMPEVFEYIYKHRLYKR